MARLRVEFMHRIGPADLVFSVRFPVWSFEWPLRIPIGAVLESSVASDLAG